MSYIVSGTLSLDTLHLPSGVHSEVPGGAALFAALGASLVRSCAVVGSVGEDFPQRVLTSLSERDVDVRGVLRQEQPTLRWEARYSQDFEDRETLARIQGAGDNAPTLPQYLLGEEPCVLLGSMSPKHQQALLTQCGADARHGVDTMAHWITKERDILLGLIQGASVVFASLNECMLLGEEHDPVKAAQSLIGSGAALVVMKAGAQGAYLVQENAPPTYCPAVPAAIVDPTGTGDALAGAFMAAQAAGSSPVEALAHGVAAAAIALEGVSCSGFAAGISSFPARVQWALGHIEIKQAI